jgi:hypothetical protein
VYRGEIKDSNKDGYGHNKYMNKDEYDGQWQADWEHGKGVFKEASTGRVERRIYENS